MIQGHHLKCDPFGRLVFFFPGYMNEIRLPNPEARLYHCRSLTFVLQSEPRSSVSGRTTRSRTRNEASGSQQPQPDQPQAYEPPQPQQVFQQMHQAGWVPYGQVPGYTPGYQPGWRPTPPPVYEAGGSGWQSASSSEWDRARQEMPSQSSSSGGPPPLSASRRSRSTRGSREIADLSLRVGDLYIRTGEIQDTLNTFAQGTTAWQQQANERMEQQMRLQRAQDEMLRAYFMSQGYHPPPPPGP